MAAEVIWDQSPVSAVVGLDVSTQQPQTATGTKASSSTDDQGNGTVRAAALTVAVALALLWYLGAIGLKSVRI